MSYGGSSGGGKKWLDPECILKLLLTRLANRLDVESEKGTLRRAPRYQPQTDGSVLHPLYTKKPSSTPVLLIYHVDSQGARFCVWSPLALVFPRVLISWFPSWSVLCNFSPYFVPVVLV